MAELDASRTHAREGGSVEEPWRLLSVDEVSDRVGRSTRTVREWARTGQLPVVRLDGGALAFDLEDVKAFAAARRVAVNGDEWGDRER